MSIIPPISESGLYQPWFVINAYIIGTSEKHKVKIDSLIQFRYSTKRFDFIKNHQEVDWRFYRDYLTDIQKKWDSVTIGFVRHMIRLSKNTRGNRGNAPPHNIFHNIFPVSDHHVPPNWLNEDVIHTFSGVSEVSGNKNTEIYQSKKAPLSMPSYAYNIPNYRMDKKCSRPWDEC